MHSVGFVSCHFCLTVAIAITEPLTFVSLVSRVQNVFGPQTHWQPEAKKIKQEPGVNENQPSDASLQALDERLLNMETHLKLKSGMV